jgi:predicted Zn-dependent protease
MKIIYVQRIGTYNTGKQEWVEVLKSLISNYFDVEVRELPAITIQVKWKDPRHKIIDVDLFFYSIMPVEIPMYGISILAITEIDIKNYRTNWLYGCSLIGKRRAVVSSARATSLNLFLKSGVHELCHSFGMDHCSKTTCNMYGARSEEEALWATTEICPACREILRKALEVKP